MFFYFKHLKLKYYLNIKFLNYIYSNQLINKPVKLVSETYEMRILFNVVSRMKLIRIDIFESHELKCL